MKHIFALALFLLFGNVLLRGQTETRKKPKLVVGIVVDQMRFDYLYKYEKKYSEGGFKRIMRQGYNFKNTQYNYTPTVTAAGHASIYTGTTPSYHGVINNSWFDRYSDSIRGNVEDKKEIIVGSKQPNSLGVSPRNLLSTTISDELRLGTNFAAKVISISLKDRSAVMPGGHTANGVYWHDFTTSPGYFVTSSFYMDALPPWVSAFNTLEKSNAYLNTSWNTLYPVATYTESAADDNRYEPSLGGKPRPVFPYDFKDFRSKYKASGTEYQMLWVSPAGNTMLTEFAMEAIKNENLGVDEVPDMLCISYTVPDVIGHTFGPQSVELEDIYLRLDQDIGRLLNYLDNTLGTDNYLLFLTADHAAIPNVSYLNDHKVPTGIAQISQYREALTQFLNSKYSRNEWIQYFEDENVYLNREVITQRKLDLTTVQQDVATFLINLKGIRSALTAHDLQTQNYEQGMNQRVQNGYDAKKSGDVLLVFDPGFIVNPNQEGNVSQVKGTTHGSGYTYDTHVPLLWFGDGIPKGESVRKVAITDIAPSLAMFLNIQLPNASLGEPLREIFVERPITK